MVARHTYTLDARGNRLEAVETVDGLARRVSSL